MSRNVLDDLPADLAFIAPVVRAMLAVRAGFHPPVDPKEFPEAAAAAELDKCGEHYQAILYAALKQKYSGLKVSAFNRQVIAFGDSLWKWLNSYSGDWDGPEADLLFTIVGTIPREKEMTWFQRAGSALGTAYGRLTRPHQQ